MLPRSGLLAQAASGHATSTKAGSFSAFVQAKLFLSMHFPYHLVDALQHGPVALPNLAACWGDRHAIAQLQEQHELDEVHQVPSSLRLDPALICMMSSKNSAWSNLQLKSGYCCSLTPQCTKGGASQGLHHRAMWNFSRTSTQRGSSSHPVIRKSSTWEPIIPKV